MLAGVGLRPLRLCSSRSPHHDLNLKAKKRIGLHVSGMARMCASLDSDGLTGRSTFAPTATSPSRRMNGPVCENFTVSVTSFTDGAFSSCGFSVTFTAGMNRRFSSSSFPVGTNFSLKSKYDFHLAYLLQHAIEQASPIAAFRCSSGGRSCRRPALRTL